LGLSGRARAVLVSRAVFDPVTGGRLHNAVVERGDLQAGDHIVGPAVIVETETATVVTSSFDAVVQEDGSLMLIRKGTVQ